MSLASLTAADLRHLIEVGCLTQEAEDPEELARHVQHALHTLIGADVVVWNELTPEGKVSTGMTFPELDAQFWARVAPGMLAHIHEHPFVQWLGTRRCRVSTAAISDLLPTRRFVQTGLYDVGYRAFAAKYQISSAVRATDGGHLVVSLNRRGRDFSRRDQTLLEAVTRPAARAYETLRCLEALRAWSRSAEPGGRPPRSSWFYVDARRIVKWGAPNLATYLERHFQQRRYDIFLPPPLAEVIGRMCAADELPRTDNEPGALTRHLAYGRANYSISVRRERADRFRVELEEICDDGDRGCGGGRALMLTRRETEAAHWAGLGKTNAEIAIILGISPRTVEKHVHAALAKFGLENRVQLARLSGEAAAAGQTRE